MATVRRPPHARGARVVSTPVPGRAPRADDARRDSMRVVVRVRGTGGADAAVHTDGPRGTRVAVAGRTYTYDRVFGPDADQGMVYEDVAGHVLDEVLGGYNCTVFAYGQTGTGKTHTMAGDLAAGAGTYAAGAGVIPRTLFRLFHVLESRGDDFGVHMSFVELYNEEVRDLLVEESSSAPLRMYEDPRGRGGVVLQGAADVPLTGAAHGLRLVRAAHARRHVAATRCNDASSRSHAVFTLTVHVREAGVRGDDVLRVGKLNLVDLAGSENIARSGAANRRAREAGVINQSLLTLGRVINALVDGSAHIPYRESKLTRLLQDSLGGRTKTCIVATVADDRANLDETLSTLDYALRAKSITLRPEANQRMLRAALIREYVAEIDHLRADLAATRAHSGVYVDADNWARLEDERAARTHRIAELERREQVAHSQLASMREQLAQNTHALARAEAARAALDTRLAAARHALETHAADVQHGCAALGGALRAALDALGTRIADELGASTAACARALDSAQHAAALVGRDVAALDDGLAELQAATADAAGARTRLDAELGALQARVTHAADAAAAGARTLAAELTHALGTHAAHADAAHSRAAAAVERELQRARREHERFAHLARAEREAGAALRTHIADAVDAFLSARTRRFDGALHAAGAELGAAQRACAADAAALADDRTAQRSAAHAAAALAERAGAAPDALVAAVGAQTDAFAAALRTAAAAAAARERDVDTLGAHVREHLGASLGGMDAALAALHGSVHTGLGALHARVSGDADAAPAHVLEHAQRTHAALAAAAADVAALHDEFAALGTNVR